MRRPDESLAAVLGEELLAPDAEVRRLAAARLPNLDPAAAAPLLLLALGDEDWRVRKDASLAGQDLLAAALERGDAEGEALILGPLVAALEPGDNVGLRNAAIDVLAGHGRGAIGAIKAAYGRLDADGRKLAVEALGRTGDAAALGALARALEDPEDNVRHAAMEAIAALGATAREQVIPVLTRALGDRDRFVQLTALHGLNALEAAAPWPQIAPLLEEPMLRAAALEAAALAESPEAPAALVRALPGARGRALAQIVGALSRLTVGELAPHVAGALREGGPEVAVRLTRAAADPARGEVPSMADPSSWRGPGSGPLSLRGQALVLAALADAPGAIEAAVDALAEPALAEPAQRALLSLGPRALGEVLSRLRAPGLAPEPEQQAALIEVAVALAAAGAPRGDEVLAAVRGAVRSPSTLVATTAAYALGRIGLPDDLRLAAERAVAAPLPVARAAESALAALADRHPEAARALAREMMHDPERYLPAAVLLEALGAPPTSGAAGRRPAAALAEDELAFLPHAAATGDVRARCAAVGAAVAVSVAGSLDLLGAALADEEREVQLAAARALGKLRAALSAASAPSARSRAEELLDLLRRSGDLELLSAADPGAAEAALAERDAVLAWAGFPDEGSSSP